MKIFRGRFRPDLAQETDGPYRDETSFKWRGKDQDCRSIADSRSETANELASDETLPIRTLATDERSAGTDEENEGIDPYNTGGFKTSEL